MFTKQVYGELVSQVCVLRSKLVVGNIGENIWKIKSCCQISFPKIFSTVLVVA